MSYVLFCGRLGVQPAPVEEYEVTVERSFYPDGGLKGGKGAA
jgi:hypothetical protein